MAKKSDKKKKPQGLVEMLREVRQFFWIILICAMVLAPLSVYVTQVLTAALEPEKYPLRTVGLTPGAKFDRNFSLTAQDGRIVTGNEYSSRAWALFFGYTHCPDVCPLTLSRLSGLWDQIRHPERIQLFFVTVDPARDTPEVLQEYMKPFNPQFIALTGEEVKIKMMERAFHIYAKKVQEKGDPDYSMDHTATVILLKSDGTFAGTLDDAEPDSAVVGKLKALTGG